MGTKLLNLALLLLATAWLAQSPDWEPGIVALGLIGTLVGLEFRSRRGEEEPLSQADRKDHDRRLFARYDKILSEAVLREELDDNLYNHHTTTAFTDRLIDFTALASMSEGMFLSESAQQSLMSATSALDRLHSVIHRHFFVPLRGPVELSNDSWYIALYPELRERYEDDEGIRRYHNAEQELKAACESAQPAFSEFRKTVKRELAV